MFYALEFSAKLLWRSVIHDLSKLSREELPTFSKDHGSLKGITFATEEYQTQLLELGEALQHHYRNNRHHPQYYDNEIDGMDLLSLVEMFLDWEAAVKNHDDGNIEDSIAFNGNKYGISDDLESILMNSRRKS